VPFKVKGPMVRSPRLLSALSIALAIGWANLAVADPAEDLFDAATRGDLAAGQALLANGVDVNAELSNNATAFMAAAQNDCLDVARVLLARGADVNVKVNDGTSALQAARLRGHANVESLLVQAAAK